MTCRFKVGDIIRKYETGKLRDKLERVVKVTPGHGCFTVWTGKYSWFWASSYNGDRTIIVQAGK